MALNFNLMTYTSFHLNVNKLKKNYIRETFKLYSYYFVLILNFTVKKKWVIDYHMSYVVGQLIAINGKLTGSYFTLYNGIQKVSFFKSIFFNHPLVYSIEEFKMFGKTVENSRMYAKEFYKILFGAKDEDLALVMSPLN